MSARLNDFERAILRTIRESGRWTHRLAAGRGVRWNRFTARFTSFPKRPRSTPGWVSTDWGSGYFASRAAALGAVGAEVVKATFYNFDPGLVERSMDGAWETAAPEQLSAARLTAADRMMRRLAGDMIDSLAPAAEIARTAALAACERPEGRALFAGHAQLGWPEEPHLVLWHAQTLLREFRGDGHIAALTAQGTQRVRGAGHTCCGRRDLRRCAEELATADRRRLGSSARLASVAWLA